MPVSLELNLPPPAGGKTPSLRTIYVTGCVDSDLAHKAILSLEELDRSDGDIRIVLNSEGGSEQDGYAIFDAITMLRNRVIIDAYGSVMSIAAAIFQAADLRRIAPNADFMIHEGSVNGLDPTMPQQDIEALAANIQRGGMRYYTILSQGSQQPLDIVQAWCRDETTFNAEETVGAGFADEIIQPLKTRALKKRKRSKRT
jgi:ATP-dependent Clp protease protease subunit